jgi:flavin reductase (DIM6/NTAB) family NADH-FMN oxidoreductase RutF
MTPGVDPGRFREILGQYPTGVVVVTALDAAGAPIGMTVGSFNSVSLDPPLVAFLPDKGSSSWRALQAAGKRFCVNVLAADQEWVCRQVATRKQDKFDGIGWRPGPGGLPVVEGCVAYIECSVESIAEAGDHHIVIGRVEALDVEKPSVPLLFLRGGYGSFTPLSLAAGDADLVDGLRLVDLARGYMERLAARLDAQVTAVCLVRDELVLTAAAGQSGTGVAPTRVGQRLPWVPPLGALFAAYDPGRERAWLDALPAGTPAELREHHRSTLHRIRDRGYSVALGHTKSATLERVATGGRRPDPRLVRDAIEAMSEEYNPATLDPGRPHELHMLAAPVFGPGGEVAYQLNLWGPPDAIEATHVDALAAELTTAAEAATAEIQGVPPHG